MSAPKNLTSKLERSKYQFLTFLKDESGNVESALVIIPLLLLFLSILQIAASVMARSTSNNIVQGDVSRTALFGGVNSPLDPNVASNTPISSTNSTENSVLPLSGGGSLIISKRLNSLPILTPLLLSQDKFLSSGIALDENP